MDTEQGGESPPLGTWHLASRSESGISCNDFDGSDSSEGEEMSQVNVFTGYRRFGTGSNQGNQGYNGGSYRFKQQKQGSGPNWRGKQFLTGREAYWGSTGPRTEISKLLGYTVELPVIAPMSAPPEDKKLILSQTKDRIQETGTGDWMAKTQLLAQRFVVAVPNATHEAIVRVDWV